MHRCAVVSKDVKALLLRFAEPMLRHLSRNLTIDAHVLCLAQSPSASRGSAMNFVLCISTASRPFEFRKRASAAPKRNLRRKAERSRRSRDQGTLYVIPSTITYGVPGTFTNCHDAALPQARGGFLPAWCPNSGNSASKRPETAKELVAWATIPLTDRD